MGSLLLFSFIPYRQVALRVSYNFSLVSIIINSIVTLSMFCYSGEGFYKC